MRTNIAIFGFMGVGKSEVGHILADRLGKIFIDLDEEIVKRAGKPIAAIFKEDGETTFRELESNFVSDVSARTGLVVACGGGVVLNEKNLSNLRRSAKMILLTADPETILKRLEGDESRPLLKVEDKLERIKNLLSTRNPHYCKAADIIIDTSGKKPDQVADEILRHLQGTVDT